MTTDFAVSLAIAMAAVLIARFAAARVVLGPKAKELPKPGERWALREKKGDPWPSKRYAPVAIIDVRDGWVRYDMSAFKDQRLELDHFARMYRRVDA